MLGDSGVGKSSLINQFMSSEYMNTYDASLGKCGKCLLRLPGLISARASPRLSCPWRPPRKLCMRSPPPGMSHDPIALTLSCGAVVCFDWGCDFRWQSNFLFPLSLTFVSVRQEQGGETFNRGLRERMPVSMCSN